MGLKIKEAIKRFNETKKESTPKMTQTTLGVLVLPDMRPKTAGWYISQWNSGFEEGKLRIKEILIIKEETGVSLDFLFGINNKKN
jgi:hypothetical protein